MGDEANHEAQKYRSDTYQAFGNGWRMLVTTKKGTEKEATIGVLQKDSKKWNLDQYRYKCHDGRHLWFVRLFKEHDDFYLYRPSLFA